MSLILVPPPGSLQKLVEENLFDLHSISVSDIDPPVQMLWMYNEGDLEANFTIDLDPFDILKDHNYGHAVIECLTEEGSVPPQSFFSIKIRFSPLEMNSYHVTLRILLELSACPLEITIRGTPSINPAVSLRPLIVCQVDNQNPGGSSPSITYDHRVPISLSPVRISFQHFVPTGHKVTRLNPIYLYLVSCVFLTNLHTQSVMSFRWPEVPIEGGGVIKFKPDSGRIPPREEVSCLVIVQAGSCSAIISTAASCIVEDESDKVLYEFAMEQWKKKVESFNLMDSENMKQGKKSKSTQISVKPIEPQPISCLLAISVYIGSVMGLYDLVPPRERARMNHAEPLEIINPIVDEEKQEFDLILSKFEREMCQEVISDILWDTILCPEFESYTRQATKRQAPLYEDYKQSELEKEMSNENEEKVSKLPMQPIEEILEASVFNLIQEMSSNFIDSETRTQWSDLLPVQPTAFVNVNKYKEYL